MDDKTYEHLRDSYDGESECCGAPVYLDICSECGEHCDLMEDEDEV